MIIGFGAALLFTPFSGNELRRRLFGRFEDEMGELHTYNIQELMGENSDTLEHIKERLEK